MTAKTELTRQQRHALLSRPAGWLACGFGSGLSPVAQGTFGSLAALLPWLALTRLPMIAYLLVLIMGFVIGVWVCDVAGRLLGVADHRSVVWDEFVGQWIALIPLVGFTALGVSGFQWWLVLAGFVLFRIFDVWKPWPISWLDRRMKGGLGVMIDDVVAGVFAAVVLAALIYALPSAL
jgi:phosphatidylglycerophosphatase A